MCRSLQMLCMSIARQHYTVRRDMKLLSLPSRQCLVDLLVGAGPFRGLRRRKFKFQKARKIRLQDPPYWSYLRDSVSEPGTTAALESRAAEEYGPIREVGEDRWGDIWEGVQSKGQAYWPACGSQEDQTRGMAVSEIEVDFILQIFILIWPLYDSF